MRNNAHPLIQCSQAGLLRHCQGKGREGAFLNIELMYFHHSATGP